MLSRTTTGVVMSLASSLSFALNLTTARLTYAAGGDPFTVSLARTAFLVAVLFIVLKAASRPVRMPRRQVVARIAIGLLMAVQILTVLAAIELMPLGLAILIYYTYPLIIAAIVAALDGERPGLRRIAAMAAALVGLAIALGVQPEGVDGRGLVYVVASAAAFAAILVWSGRAMGGQDSHILSFHVMGVAEAVFLAVALAGHPLHWPGTALGWGALATSSILFTTATLCLFGAIARIGAVRASLIDYGSPVWAILLGMLLLGESMRPLQWAGAALVVGAILFDQLADMRARRAVAKA